MSLVWKITLTITDEKGQNSQVSFHLPYRHFYENVYTGTDQPMTLITMIMDTLEPLISGYISAGSMTFSWFGGVNKYAADPDSDVEEGALFVYRTENGNTVRQRIPTFKEDYIQAGSRAVDHLNADVQAFLTYLLNPGASFAITGDPCDRRGEDLVSLQSAKENFTASRNT